MRVAEIVRGAPALEPAFIQAARRLVEKGAAAITSSCGFSIRHQVAAAHAVNVPVALSSVLLLPSLLKQLAPSAKIAVLTFDATRCGEDVIGLPRRDDRTRVVVGGIEGGVFWRNELTHPTPATDDATVQHEVDEAVVHLREQHPEIGAILFECAWFPSIAPAIRKSANLPVYDITTLCRMLLESAPPA
ncbi:MAG: hypothetical protein K0R99_4610 [Microbacterium sp.]|nr:hypothetical protein [Microbacterium sp.]